MSSPPDIRSKQPNRFVLGIDHLLRIRSDQLAFYTRLHRDYGDVVQLRLGPYRLWYLFHPDFIEPVLTRQADAFIRFRRMMAVLRQWNGDSLLLAEGQHWRERRRKVLPAFQSRRLPAYGEAVVDETARLCETLAESADSRGQLLFDADQAMARLALNVAIRTLFGMRPVADGDRIETAVQDLSIVAFAESTSPLNIPNWLPLPLARRKRRAMRDMDEFVMGLVREALERSDDGGAYLISSLIEHHERRAAAIRDDAMSLLIAGHETSGALLAWALAALAAHPVWLGRALHEVDNVLGGSPPKTSDLARLPTITAILNETLRLYPPAYTLFLREALRDVEINGHMIRRGDLVQIVPFITQRDGRFFKDAKQFDPQRFMGEPDWPPYAYLPFGAGPRVCIGQNFGLMETALALTTMLQWMEPQPCDRMPAPAARFSLRPAAGMPLQWRTRRF
ncbi:MULTISPECIES: cytochrome P450 [Rhizobium]|uniref:Cytochrome P450 n=1 Tax=Rhizobium paranaense TaxID=1650438 RepID=A0A7W9D3C2_9HYPH|nr:cytochrome P450 [Rhizobium paranaense]MBB5575766.1 cytochrome P450 [Rhizobium paranaense]